jgi:hypothetical protein
LIRPRWLLARLVATRVAVPTIASAAPQLRPATYRPIPVSEPHGESDAVLTGVSETGFVAGYDGSFPSGGPFSVDVLVGRPGAIHRIHFAGTLANNTVRPNALGAVAVGVVPPGSDRSVPYWISADGTVSQRNINPAWSVQPASPEDNGVTAATIDAGPCPGVGGLCGSHAALIDPSGAIRLLDEAPLIGVTASANGWSTGLVIRSDSYEVVAWEDDGTRHVITASRTDAPGLVIHIPLDINDSGTVVGAAIDATTSFVNGFTWTPTRGLTPLSTGTGTGAIAFGVSRTGRIVGLTGRNESGGFVAGSELPTVWDAGKAYESHIGCGAAFVDVNDAYEIAGSTKALDVNVATYFHPERPRVGDPLALTNGPCDGRSAVLASLGADHPIADAQAALGLGGDQPIQDARASVGMAALSR